MGAVKLWRWRAANIKCRETEQSGRNANGIGAGAVFISGAHRLYALDFQEHVYFCAFFKSIKSGHTHSKVAWSKTKVITVKKTTKVERYLGLAHEFHTLVFLLSLTCFSCFFSFRWWLVPDEMFLMMCEWNIVPKWHFCIPVLSA